MWPSENDDDHDNINKPVQLSIVSHFPYAVHFLQLFPPRLIITPRERDTEQVFLTMRDNGSPVSRSRKISHTFFNLGGCVDRGGYRSQDTRYFYSNNWVAIVDVEGRGGDMSPDSHYPPQTNVSLINC